MRAAGRLKWIAFTAMAVTGIALGGQPSERAEVSIVEVPVTAVDAQGRIVRDLTAGDFAVTDEGEPVELIGCHLVDVAVPLVTPPPGAAAASHVQIGRHFAFVFDLTFNDLAGLATARQAATHFVLEKMREGDDAAVFTIGTANGTRMTMNFTKDREQLLDAIGDIAGLRGQGFLADSASLMRVPALARLKPFRPAWELQKKSMNPKDGAAMEADAYLRAERQNYVMQYRGSVGTYLESLKLLARALELIPGRKLTLLFSHGFDSKAFGGETLHEAADNAEKYAMGDLAKMDTSTRDVDTRNIDTLHQAAAQFSSSDCRIFCIDPGGTRQPSELPDTADTSFRTHTALETLASTTGGEVFRHTNTYDRVAERIDQGTSAYYLLLYRAPSGTKGKYHKIGVDVSRPGVRLSHRKGYFEEKPFEQFTDLEKQLQIAALLGGDTSRSTAIIRTAAIPFPLCAVEGSQEQIQAGCLTPVACVTELPFSILEESGISPEHQLEFFFFALETGTGNVLGYAHGQATSPAHEPGEGGLRCLDVIPLAPGAFTIRSIVRDLTNGTCLTGAASVSVGSRHGVAVAACILSEKERWTNVLPKKSAIAYPLVLDGKQLAARAGATVMPGDTCTLLVKVYGIDRRSDQAGPDLQASIVTPEGLQVRNIQGELLSARWANDSEYEIAVRLTLPSALPEGPYGLYLEARDIAGGQKGTARLPIEIQSKAM